MSEQDLKGEFGTAYVRAVSHAAGYFVNGVDRMMDNDGVDLSIFARANNGPVRSPRLDVQVKTTSLQVASDPFVYDLEVKAYNELCDPNWQVPRILVLVAVPDNRSDWVAATERELLLRYSGYWRSFRGETATQNSSTTRVLIPKAAVFHVPQLRDVMDRISNGGLP